MVNEPTNTTEAVETDSLQVEDIIKDDEMFNAFMNQLYALKCSVSAYCDMFPNIVEVPDYLIALHDNLDDAIAYTVQAIEEYVDTLGESIAQDEEEEK